MAVAVVAVTATAWLTSLGTADQAREDVERSLEVDGLIYDQLLGYASSHPDWSDVDDLVQALADDTGRRIALTTRDHRLIVDSEQFNGGRPGRLPRVPAAVVDPFNPVTPFYGESELALDWLDDSSIGDGTDAAVVVDGALNTSDTLTADEVAQREDLADEAAACLDAAGVRYQRFSYADTAPDISVDVQDEAAPAAYQRCVDEERLYAPSAAGGGRADRARPTAVALACVVAGSRPRPLTTMGCPSPTSSVATTARPTPTTAAMPPPSGSSTNRCGPTRPCSTSAPAPPAACRCWALAADAPSWRPWLWRSWPWRSPWPCRGGCCDRSHALIAATRGMEQGHRAQRVDVTGHDELADLARSFNAMAEAVASDEEKRRRLVNDVAHELRTPLANLRGYLEAALDGVTPTNDQLLASLHDDTLLLQRLVDDLQTLALAEAGQLALHRAPIDLAELAEQVVAVHKRQADTAGIALVLERPTGRPDDPGSPVLSVDGDPGRLRQALGNLVSNAVRYSSAGDRVTVRAHGHTADQPDVVVDVVDTGTGIPADDLPHVFDRFWRADVSRTRATGGSGLGLSICRELVEAHGGQLTATSTLGEGSTFTVHLPATPPA